MKDQIEAYKSGVIDLGWLISSLESLRHALQAVSEDWIDLFWSRWGVLEEIHSISVVRQERIPDATNADVDRIVAEIAAMIAEILPLPDGDGSR